MSYFSRVTAPEEYHFSAAIEDGDNMQRPRDIIEATDEQLALWQDIQQIVQRTSTRLTKEDEHVIDDKQDREKLKGRLLKLWMLLICHTTGARQYKSPLLSFCAMLSIKPLTQSWTEPGNFDSSLSAIPWVVQLLIFYDGALKEQ